MTSYESDIMWIVVRRSFQKAIPTIHFLLHNLCILEPAVPTNTNSHENDIKNVIMRIKHGGITTTNKHFKR